MSQQNLIRELVAGIATMKHEQLTPMALELYVAAVSDIPLDRLKLAFTEWLKASRFFPQPDELRAMNARIPLTAEQERRARQKLLARIDFNPKQLPSVIDKPAVPSEMPADQAKALFRIAEQSVRQVPDREARIAELERQKQELIRRRDMAIDAEHLAADPDPKLSGAEGLVM